MNDQHLLQQIQSFQLCAKPQLFLDALQKSTKWERKFCIQCIEEYKKFIFLKAVSHAPVSPCYAVAMVWQTHLTFSTSYWIDLCETILGKELHFEPIEEHELSLIEQHYKNTWYLYIKYFQQTPPADVWPKATHTPFKSGHITHGGQLQDCYTEDEAI